MSHELPKLSMESIEAILLALRDARDERGVPCPLEPHLALSTALLEQLPPGTVPHSAGLGVLP